MRLSLEQGTSLWALSDHRARKFRKQEQERREAALRAQEQGCAHGALFKPGLSEGACVEPQEIRCAHADVSSEDVGTASRIELVAPKVRPFPPKRTPAGQITALVSTQREMGERKLGSRARNAAMSMSEQDLCAPELWQGHSDSFHEAEACPSENGLQPPPLAHKLLSNHLMVTGDTPQVWAAIPTMPHKGVLKLHGGKRQCHRMKQERAGAADNRPLTCVIHLTAGKCRGTAACSKTVHAETFANSVPDSPTVLPFKEQPFLQVAFFTFFCKRGTVEPYAPPPHFHTEPQPAATALGWWLRSERQHLQDFSRSARFTHAADSFLPQNTAGKGSGFLHGDKMTVMDDVLLLGGSW
ncbi:hypothetical protein Anapl_08279 [Anas platyrhynchos]|uniref:Uncharacterized protein n=1 Tax=Anas platyrhynchos TaxID=8839 RepID=R0LIQ7_ANAPL|nr:hypothetical protein Anapl_08279 [Anas platyrhynchos]